MENKKILIFGGSGFIGSHLAKKLVEQKADVTIVCRNPEDIQDIDAFRDVTLVKGDTTQYEDVVLHVPRKDIVINLATVVYNTGKFDPYIDLEINCKSQINVLEALKNSNSTARYIYIGSSMQFGRVDPKDLPVSENHVQSPVSLYGIHKATAEAYCKVYERAHGLSSIIVRLPPVYGPGITGKETRSVVEMFIKKALRNEPFRVNGFGEDLKDFIYIDDVVDALVAIMASSVRDGVFHVGSGTGVKFADVARMVIDECKMGSYELVPFPPELEKFEVGSFYFDIKKIKKELKWHPRVDIREGIKKMVAFYKK